MDSVLQGLIAIAVSVSACVGYFYFSNLLLDKVIFPPRGKNISRNINRANIIRPWFFLFPALSILGLYLVYPFFVTLFYSFNERIAGGIQQWVGLANYQKMFSEPKFWEALKNNMLWLLVVPAMSTGFGLISAQLSDRISWGNIAKSFIFMPMAISFVGASVIWKLVYDTRPVNQDQIGVLNALWLQFESGWLSFILLRILPVLIVGLFTAICIYMIWSILQKIFIYKNKNHGLFVRVINLLLIALLGWFVYIGVNSIFGLTNVEYNFGEPQTWLTIDFWNNFFLMAILIWIQTGFAMVILSAALRGIPEETIEAAIIDGANPFQIFFKIKVPQISTSIMVVWTTITVTVLKVFDIVFGMTNGQWGSQVLANYMFDKLFSANNWGIGSASAIIIMLLVAPILIWNIRNASKELK